MIPFPGESVIISDGADLTGGGEEFNLWGVLARRAFTKDADSSTIWRLWVYPGDMDYLEESGLSCDVSWVIEVLSGTITVDLAEMADPTFEDTSTPVGTPLGTHTVTGPATLVVPSGFTADQVATGDDALMLEVVGVSGSAVVQQVKLRVWPTAGVVGGWSDAYPSWETTPAFPNGFEGAVVVHPNVVTGDIESSWDATMAQGVADFAAAAPGPHTFSEITTAPGYLAPSRSGSLAAFHSSGDGGVTWGTVTNLSAGILVLVGADWRSASAIDPTLGLAEGVDYIRPPTEVRFESEFYLVQQVGDGSTGWVNPYAYVGIASEETPVESATLGTDSLDDLAFTPLGGGSYEIDLDAVVDAALPTPASSSSLTQSVSLPTDSQIIVVNLAHTAAIAAPGWPNPPALAGTGAGVEGFGVGTPGVDFDPMLTYAILPPYRVWVPTATIITKLRQLHRDDGQGVTPPRAFGGASRIRTGRAYGYD